MFVGSLNDTSIKFANHVTDSRMLGEIGLGTFTEQSLRNLLENRETATDIADYIASSCNDQTTDEDERRLAIASGLLDGLLGTGKDKNGSHGTYYKYDPELNKYIKTEITRPVKELVDFWNEAQKDLRYLDTNTDIRDEIYAIKNSLEGCVVRYPIINLPSPATESSPGEGGDNQAASNTEASSGEMLDIGVIRTYFQTKDRAKNSREMMINGDPKISTIPRRATGGKYDFARTQNIQKKGIDTKNDINKNYGNIGRYRNHVAGDEEITDQKVASKLRLTYNHGLGYFESGTQHLIARLLEDLPAPDLKEIDLDGIDEAKFSDMYDFEGGFFMGQFSAGLALPLSVHNGNPNTFGPNVIGKESEYRKEKIRVVNRANSSFARGDIVMCCLIDNEWIVQGFGGNPAELGKVEFKTGKWSFIKMIADSDAYFRDNRYFTTGLAEHNFVIFENEYALLRRQSFYHHLSSVELPSGSFGKYLGDVNDLPLIAKLNSIIDTSFSNPNGFGKTTMSSGDIANLEDTQPADIVPSRRYYQSTIFDQLGEHMGGNSSGNIIGRTNRRINPDPTMTFGNDLAEKACQVPLFWGPSFTEGYVTSQTRKLEKTIDSYLYGSEEFMTAPSGGLDVTNNTREKNYPGEEKTFMFYNERDTSLSQLPAEVATNASPSGDNGWPLENIELLMRKEISLNENLPVLYSDYFADKDRLTWIYSKSGDPTSSVFDLKPNINTIIDFIPLSFVMAGNGDTLTKLYSKGAYLSEYDTYAGSRACIFSGVQLDNLWGKMITRHEQAFPGQSSSTSLLQGIDIPPEYKTDDAKEHIESLNNNTISWDKYIHQVPRSGPDDAPWIFRADGEIGANVMGIVGARNTFSISNGGTINFSTDYKIGLNAQVTVAGGNVNTFTLGFGVGTTVTSFVDTIRQNTVPLWGTRDCRPSTLGHTSLFVNVFDHWPEQNTIYDVRYFTPLHFCEGNGAYDFLPEKTLINSGVFNSGDWDFDLPQSGYNSVALASINRQRYVDELKYVNTDFRIPTYAFISQSGVQESIDNTPIPVGTNIDRYGTFSTISLDENGICVSGEGRIPVRPIQEWRVNTICRGMMVTPDGGFRHQRRSIGVSEEYAIIISEGTGFVTGDKYEDTDFGITIKVNQIGASGEIKTFDLINPGEGMNFNDFYDTGIVVRGVDDKPDKIAFGHSLTIRNSITTEKSATILFQTGKVYDNIYDTKYAKRHGSTLSLTPTSQPGENGPIVGRKVSSLTITDPSPDNRYDAFYFHVNDATHVDVFNDQGVGPYSFNSIEFTNGDLQYVSLEIGTA